MPGNPHKFYRIDGYHPPKRAEIKWAMVRRPLSVQQAPSPAWILLDHSTNENVKGIVVAPEAPLVNHLLFADDCLLFFKANEEGAITMNEMIKAYCDASGQRVNLSKSSIFFSKGCPNNKKEVIKNILVVPNESLSERYLGLPWVVGKSKKQRLQVHQG